jgi:hypothetical protein
MLTKRRTTPEKKGDLEAELAGPERTIAALSIVRLTKPPLMCHGANPDHPGRPVDEVVINAD